jgi:hypothetical protein
MDRRSSPDCEFLGQVSLLMRTAEESLMKRGWREMFNSRQSSSVTSDLLDPERWMPRDVYRLYVAAEEDGSGADFIIYLAVLLDQEGAWAGFNEPWITCGACKFLPGKRPDRVKPHEYYKAHLESEHDPDGAFFEYDHKEGTEWFDRVGLCYEVSMALPLVEIKSAEDLRRRVVDPLVAEIGKAVKSS